MSTDLFGMAVENRKSIKELILVSSPRVNYHSLPDVARSNIPPILFDNLELISLETSLLYGLIVCKHCHMLYLYAVLCYAVLCCAVLCYAMLCHMLCLNI